VLPPQPRCEFVGEDADTGAIVRCARWKGHPGEHRGYQDIITRMCEYIAARTGVDTQDDLTYSSQLVIMKQARAWYDKVVTE
jgi:hypothetical protein